ncbi:MAG: HAD-IIA family hydrolase, partial [Candidatus Hodarchaeota archaeon]
NLDFVKGILADIDGTLYFKGNPIPNTIDTVSKIREKGLKLLFLTNTDSKSPTTILKILQEHGFSVNINEIFTPIIAVKEFLFKHPNKKSYFVTTKEVAKEFQAFKQIKDNEVPDYVIIGDFHDDWDINRLNLAFKYILKGAKLLGTQGNIYYLDRNGEPVIDTGSFVYMIAKAANVNPKIFGKPSKEYFLQALEKIGLTPNEVVVIGDDFESDIQGAINARIKGILVKTGKGRFYNSAKSKIKPYLILDSFSSLNEFIRLGLL